MNPYCIVRHSKPFYKFPFQFQVRSSITKVGVIRVRVCVHFSVLKQWIHEFIYRTNYLIFGQIFLVIYIECLPTWSKYLIFLGMWIRECIFEHSKHRKSHNLFLRISVYKTYIDSHIVAKASLFRPLSSLIRVIFWKFLGLVFHMESLRTCCRSICHAEKCRRFQLWEVCGETCWTGATSPLNIKCESYQRKTNNKKKNICLDISRC